MGFGLKAFAWGCLLGALLVIRRVCTWLSDRPPPPPSHGTKKAGLRRKCPQRVSVLGTPDSQGPRGFPLAHGGRLSFPSCLFLAVLLAPRVIPCRRSGRPQCYPQRHPQAPPTPHPLFHIGKRSYWLWFCRSSCPGEAGAREPGTVLSNYRIRCAPRN